MEVGSQKIKYDKNESLMSMKDSFNVLASVIHHDIQFFLFIFIDFF